MIVPTKNYQHLAVTGEMALAFGHNIDTQPLSGDVVFTLTAVKQRFDIQLVRQVQIRLPFQDLTRKKT